MYRLFVGAMVVFVAGMLIFALGEYVVSDWSDFTLPVGAAIAGISGLVIVVTGIAVILSGFGETDR